MRSVEDDIVECFRQGGGVPYEKFRRFHEVMAEDSGQSVLSATGTPRIRMMCTAVMTSAFKETQRHDLRSDSGGMQTDVF